MGKWYSAHEQDLPPLVKWAMPTNEILSRIRTSNLALYRSFQNLRITTFVAKEPYQNRARFLVMCVRVCVQQRERVTIKTGREGDRTRERSKRERKIERERARVYIWIYTRSILWYTELSHPVSLQKTCKKSRSQSISHFSFLCFILVL